jgi:hypothetical protein
MNDHHIDHITKIEKNKKTVPYSEILIYSSMEYL